jgi:hypothetical protein
MVLLTMRTAFLLILLLSSVGCTAVSEPCVVQSYAHDTALNILLINDGFSQEAFTELGLFIEQSILAKEPFTSKPYLNIYRIENANDELCIPGERLPVLEDPRASPLPPLECDIEEVKRLANSCAVQHGKLLILTSDTVTSQTSLTHGESGVMFLDMKNQPPEIIQHEFAHFFNLKDERATLYSHSLGPGREPGPNCVTSEEEAQQAWRNYYPEAHVFPQGCAGNAAWYKPESKTLMDRFPDPSWEYGEFNRRYLASVLECCYGSVPLEGCERFFSAYPGWQGCR